jgi:hypothetical protein
VATAEIAPDAPVAEEPLHEVQPSIDVLVADEAPVVVEDSVAEEPVATEEPIIAGPIAAETPAEPVGIVEPPIAAIDERGPERADTSATGLKMMGVRSAHSTAGTRGDAGDRARPLSLALHTGKSISRLRSSNLRLIPGLEFAPLRHEDNLRRQSIAPLINEPMPQPEVRSRAVKVAIEETALPPLPSLGDSPGTEGLPPGMRIAAEPQTSREPAERGLQTLTGPSRVSPSRPATSRPASTPVAPPAAETRETVELTPLEELARRLENARIPVVEEPEPRTAFEPSIVSDTLANILVAQGAIAEAMKAFQTLARIKPERFEYYQGRIHEMKWRLQNPGGTWPPEQ